MAQVMSWDEWEAAWDAFMEGCELIKDGIQVTDALLLAFFLRGELLQAFTTVSEAVARRCAARPLPSHAALSLACTNGVLIVPLIPVLVMLKAEREVREALKALEAVSEAAKTAAAAPPAADEGGASSNAALSLACICCLRLPSDMDDERETHPICGMCRDQKLPTTYLCGEDCPANPGALELHWAFHKEQVTAREDGGVMQQQAREAAEVQARIAAQSRDKYDELLAEGARYATNGAHRQEARAYREAIALEPDEPAAYYNLGSVLANSGHSLEAAQRFLEAMERVPVGSETWAEAIAEAFGMLRLEAWAEAAKPDWWNDEGLKALSARVLRAAPNDGNANQMRAYVLSGVNNDAWEVEPRSAAEFKKAAALYQRAVALCPAPAPKAALASLADWCRSKAEAKAIGGRDLPPP